jgi:biopolymer transport protein ExbB
MAEQIRTALDYLGQGGWVMVPLAAVSVVMWMLIYERLRAYRTLAQRDGLRRRLLNECARGIGAGRPADAPDQPVRPERFERSARSEPTGESAAYRAALRVSARKVDDEIERYLALITMLVAVAPLLGLLGTVLGMTETFRVIATFGTGNTRALAGGISVALITTQTGLLIAVPGLFLRGRLHGQAEVLHHRLEELVTVLERGLDGTRPPREVCP